MKQIGIGLVGYGGIGRVHALAYRSIPFHYGLTDDVIRVVGVATTHAETAQKAASEIGCGFATSDYRELVKHPDVDVVDVTAPNAAHEEIVVAAAQAGKHIYCEKPLSMNVPEGKRMVAAASSAGVSTQMTFNFRYFPAIQRARQLIDGGFLGRVFSFRGRYYRSSYIDPLKPISWRQRRSVAGGGTLFDLGSHVLDLVYFLLGNVDQVQATLDTLIRERPASAGASETVPVDVDDIALMHLRMVSGTLGLVECSRMGTGSPNELTIEIFGEKGAIRFDAQNPAWLDVYDVRDSATPLGGMRGRRRVESIGRYDGAVAPDWSMSPSFVRTHAECQYQFLQAVSEDRDGSPDLADGLHVQSVMEAAERSSEQQRWVSVSEIMEG